MATAPALAADPYAPLQLYAGKWAVRDSAAGSHAIDNHCARTGVFFACEQVVDGKAEDLVVFLPTGAGPEGLDLSHPGADASRARRRIPGTP